VKKILFVLMSVLVLAMIVFPGFGGEPAPTQVVELKLAHAWATTHHVHVILDQWVKDVEQATNGRVK
jgi:TRAP-type C4-dicarboxylate transport system substrate-binding protein